MVPTLAVDINSSQFQRTVFVVHTNAKVSKALTDVGVQTTETVRAYCLSTIIGVNAPTRVWRRNAGQLMYYTRSAKVSQNITGLVSETIVANMLLVSLVESPEFHALLSFLEPAYKPPCRQTMTTRTDTMAAKRHCDIQETMQTDATAVAVMTDMWTSLVNDQYISLTARYIMPAWTMRTPTLANALIDEQHTRANIIALLSEITSDWRLSEKVVAVIYDGASNMRDCGARNGWIDVDCSTHKIHLSVMSAIGINKVSVSHYISPKISLLVAHACSCVHLQNLMQPNNMRVM